MKNLSLKKAEFPCPSPHTLQGGSRAQIQTQVLPNLKPTYSSTESGFWEVIKELCLGDKGSVGGLGLCPPTHTGKASRTEGYRLG